ncbi:Activin receptor [Dirofilaria immitis]
MFATTTTLLFFNILYITIPQGYSLVCYMCDSIGETNCFDATCTGTACIKRFALIDGFLRVQKMCQQTVEPFLEYCETNVLWEGGREQNLAYFPACVLVSNATEKQ